MSPKTCNHGFKKEPNSGAYSDSFRILAVAYSGLGTQIVMKCKLCGYMHEVWITGLEVTLKIHEEKEYDYTF